MSDATRFEIGSKVHCTDGVCGKLLSVVVDPVARSVTHIVVEPEHRWGLGRLVPLDRVTGSGDDGLQLRCTLAEFEDFEMAEETHFLSEEGADWGYPGSIFAMPYFGLGRSALEDFGGNAPQPVVYDKLPVGEVGVRRGQPVEATDGHIGKVQGLVIDGSDGRVTHLLLQEGHLWGRKEVAIPISAVAAVATDGDVVVRLTLSKAEVEQLPAVGVESRG